MKDETAAREHGKSKRSIQIGPCLPQPGQIGDIWSISRESGMLRKNDDT